MIFRLMMEQMSDIEHKVTAHLESLEVEKPPGNSKVVREKSGKIEKGLMKQKNSQAYFQYTVFISHFFLKMLQP